MMIKEIMLKEKDLPLRIRRDVALVLSDIINISNGMAVEPPNKTSACYKYYVGPGNYGGHIFRLFKARWWWVPIYNESQID